MTRRRGLFIVIIAVIAGVLIAVDHAYFLGSRQDSDNNQFTEKFSDTGKQTGKGNAGTPAPSVNASKDKIGAGINDKATVPNKAAEENSASTKRQETAASTTAEKPMSGNENTVPNNNPNNPNTAPAPTEAPQNNTNQNTIVNLPSAMPKAVEDKAGTIAKSEVQTDDFLKVASMLLGKLSLAEIKYLFDSASDDYWEVTPVEEIEKARNILFSKLTSEDLDQLYQLGKKYGRSMTIIDPDINVAETKAKRIKQLEEQRRKQQ